jgi:diguanylate cyclase (GGDEF)-like protein
MVDAARGGRNAAALAILALSALLLTPFLFQRSIARHRLAYTESLDPARAAASEALLSLAREIGAIRGYLLARDTVLLTDYREARAEQDRALSRLAGVRQGDSAMQSQARAFEAAARAWNESNDQFVAGEITVAQATARLTEQQEKYHRALNAGQALERSIIAAVEGVRARVLTLERRWATATIGLAVLAAAGALMVVFMMRLSHGQSALARTDSLTGLYNRLGFDELATRELSRARRNGTAITLINFDLDGFKQVNDTRGHAAGDDLLRTVGRAIRATIRDIDVGARLGGDEFGLLLPDNRALPPELAVERVRSAIRDALSREGWPVTLSVGAVTIQRRDVSVDEMIRLSDKLMYAVKNEGKNAMRHELLHAPAANKKPDLAGS